MEQDHRRGPGHADFHPGRQLRHRSDLRSRPSPPSPAISSKACRKRPPRRLPPRRRKKPCPISAPCCRRPTPPRARTISQRCEQCHDLSKGGPNKIGPNLWGVVGRPRATHEGFSYSGAMTADHGTWTYDKLFKFLKSPGDHGARHQDELRRSAQRRRTASTCSPGCARRATARCRFPPPAPAKAATPAPATPAPAAPPKKT